MSLKSEWVWMPHAGHLIVGSKCRFHLNTYVGDYLVSTVGEYVPDSATREILAQSRGVNLRGRGDEREADWMRKVGFEEIGAGRTYETLVFHATKAKDGCCPYTAASWSEIDGRGYNDAAEAFAGHLAMCEEWANKTAALLNQ